MSNRGTEFTSKFFKALAVALDMKLYFTAGYHPEADRQTERTNQTLEQYLQIYCNYQQSDWARLLPLAEFIYNNNPFSTTGISLFFANKGYHSNLQVQTMHKLASIPAEKFVVDLKDIHMRLKQAIAEAQSRYQGLADTRHLKAPTFQLGNTIFILAKFVRTTQPLRKLSEHYLGPFKIVKRVNTYSYLVKLPEHLQAIHLVFYIS